MDLIEITPDPPPPAYLSIPPDGPILSFQGGLSLPQISSGMNFGFGTPFGFLTTAPAPVCPSGQVFHHTRFVPGFC